MHQLTSSPSTGKRTFMNHTNAQPRLNYMQQSPELAKKLVDFSMAIANSGHIESGLSHLVDIRSADPDRADRHLRRALCRSARAVQREGNFDADLPRDGHQRLEPCQRGLPHHARRARQGLRSGQGRACLSGRASEAANVSSRLALWFGVPRTQFAKPYVAPAIRDGFCGVSI
jgi:hypothetical protein